LDHQEAHIFGMGGDEVKREVVHSTEPRVHSRSPIDGDRRVHEQPVYFAAIAEKLTEAREILLVGPAETKDDFKTYLDRHAVSLAKRVVGTEALEKLTDGELIAFVRGVFLRIDKMLPQL
jgi:stalled ribosome rescue protein Dom34